ncbi:MAG: histone deacetylase [Candidatus Hadarchaeales archaeon]
MRLALIYSPRYLEHNPGAWHPESPQRLHAIVETLKRNELWTNVLEPESAKMNEILTVHSKNYIELLKEMTKDQAFLDSDTPTRENTLEIALLAAGGALIAGRLVAEKKADNTFALVRPPGHHASSDFGGGFCYLNNVAIMTKDLLNVFDRIMIFDFDAHHGNGTQDIFYTDPDVLYLSIHQFPLYPGTGRVEEIGEGRGRGFNVNVPVPPGTGDGEYATIIEEVVCPIAEQFEPGLIAISAGFDGHIWDPLTQLELSSEFYGWMAERILETAKKVCGGRVVFVLEGGYNLKALGESVTNVIKALRGAKFRSPIKREIKVVETLKNFLSWKWRI